MNTNEARRFGEDLLDWYALHARDLPWRREEDWYHVWISEIMLQQTRVEQARPYFERFLERFPDVKSLATTSIDEVLLLWEGLGYYSRARNLHRAARQILERFDGRFPSDPKNARELAGVGPYTAGAVLSIAYGIPLAAIDGNVTRVLARYLALEAPVDRAGGAKIIRETAQALIEQSDPSSFNQAMMDLGATICTPKSPRCDSCPLADGCTARMQGIVEALPVTGKKSPIPHYDVAVGVLCNASGEILLTKRPVNVMLGGLWEFPGARRRDGESIADALRRGIQDRTGLAVEPAHKIVSVKHAFSHFKITMHAFSCDEESRWRVEEPVGHCRWIAPDRLDSFALHRAARKIANHIIRSESGAATKPV